MVLGRDTLLFGTRKTDHGSIWVEGTTSGTVQVPLKVEFTRYQGEGKGTRGITIYDSPVLWTLPLDGLDGKCGAVRPFMLELSASEGIPYPDDVTFTFDVPEDYLIDAVWRRENGELIGVELNVSGKVVETRFPRVAVVPTFLKPRAQLSKTIIRVLELGAQRMIDGTPTVSGANKMISDLLPLGRQTEVSVEKMPTEYMSDLMEWVETVWLTRMSFSALPGGSPPPSLPTLRQQAIVEAMTLRLGDSYALADFDRVYVLLGSTDFDLVTDWLLQIMGFRPGALALSQKVIVAWASGPTNLIHEVIHTMPYLWSGGETAVATRQVGQKSSSW